MVRLEESITTSGLQSLFAHSSLFFILFFEIERLLGISLLHLQLPGYIMTVYKDQAQVCCSCVNAARRDEICLEMVLLIVMFVCF